MSEIIAFGVGAAKTGTHSLAAMFEENIRAAHEPDAEELLRIIFRHSEGATSAIELQQEIKTLFTRQQLQFNVSQINGFIIETIFALYPSARYVLSVRDANSWVKSFINHQMTRALAPASGWQKFRDLRFLRGHHPYRIEDAPLRRNNLYSLDAYLSYWTEHTLKVIETIPQEQLCIVSTVNILRDRGRITEFLNLSVSAVDGMKAHAFKGEYTPGSADDLEPGYFNERISHYTELLLSSASTKLVGNHIALLQEAVDPPRSVFYEQSKQDRIQATRKSMSNGDSLLNRWAFVAAESNDRWNRRAKLAASMIPDQASVADVGCGMMYLERHLRPGTKYIPIDLVKRDKRTVVVDLNATALPRFDADCIVCLGVLEYLHNVTLLLRSISGFYRAAVLSYHSIDFIPATDDRLASGWVNNYSVAEIESEFERAGLLIEEKRRFEDGPSIWRLRSVTGSRIDV